MSFLKGYGDYQMQPDHTSLRNYWIDGEVVMMADLYDEFHQRVEHAPREILRKQVEKADTMGFQIFCASELEFFPFKKTAKMNWDEKYRNLELLAQYPEDCNLMIGDRNEELIYAMRKAINNSGLKVETSKGEAGTSQKEITIKYSDPMTMADHHVYYKNIIKHVANKFDKTVTFMAKPFQDQPGSSCHIHLSLFDKKGNNIFHGNDLVLCEKRHLTASKFMLYFLGGWMKHVLDVFPFYAPYVNSYKRFVSSSFAPANLTAWSVDNRTSPFRIVGHGQSLRIEFRIPGADVNPYLAFAASIVSGLDGIEKKIEPPKISLGNIYDDTSSEEFRKIIGFFRT